MKKLFILLVICCLNTQCQGIKYQDIGAYDKNGLAIAKLRGKKGDYILIDEKKRTRSSKYTAIYNEHRGCYVAINNWNKHVLLNHLGQEISSMGFDEIIPFVEVIRGKHLALVKSNDKWGMINTAGDIVIPVKYDQILDFQNKEAIVLLDGKQGIINTDGNIIIPLKYESIRHLQDQVYLWNDGYQSGLITNGRSINLPHNTIIKGVGSRYAIAYVGGTIERPNGFLSDPIYKNGTWRLIDIYTGMVNESISALEPPCVVSENMVAVRTMDMGGYYKYINLSGFPNINGAYNIAKEFNEGLAAVSYNAGYGYINKQGRMIIPPKYDDANKFSEGFAAVKMGDKWGYIDNYGNPITSCKYDYAGAFHNGFAKVNIGCSISYYSNNHINIKGGKWGYINTKGEEILPIEYDQISDFENGRAIIRNTKIAWLINSQMRRLKEWKFSIGEVGEVESGIRGGNISIEHGSYIRQGSFFYDLNGKLIGYNF